MLLDHEFQPGMIVKRFGYPYRMVITERLHDGTGLDKRKIARVEYLDQGNPHHIGDEDAYNIEDLFPDYSSNGGTQ